MLSLSTDYHLGAVRATHTTQTSRLRLRERLYAQARRAAMAMPVSVCLGDLFDTWSNDETVLCQALAIGQALHACLGGNHDFPNRKAGVSSFDLLANILGDRMIRPSLGEPYVARVDTNEAILSLVPHHGSNALFHEALDKAKARVEPGAVNLLCVHCNYDPPWECKESTLVLTKDDVDRLLETFDYVLCGHEHNPRRRHDGRFIVLGNTYPVSFSDISPKYRWSFDPPTGFSKEVIWDPDRAYRRYTWQEFLELETGEAGVEFIEVTGDIEAINPALPALVKRIRQAWERFPDAVMIRPHFEVQALRATREVGEPTRLNFDLPSVIGGELKETPLAPLWHHYLEKALRA